MRTVSTRSDRRSTRSLPILRSHWALGLALLGCGSSETAAPASGTGAGGQSSGTTPGGSSAGGAKSGPSGQGGSSQLGAGGAFGNPTGSGAGGTVQPMGTGGSPATGAGGLSGGRGGAIGSGGLEGTKVDAAPRPADGADPAKDGHAVPPADLPKFSFFYTSLDSMRKLSGSQNGFGGDLRFGATTGLEGADKICQTIATNVNPMFGLKTWRAFLSVLKGPGDQPVHAIDRVGPGPWYDRNGRLIAMNKAGLLNAGKDRPAGDPQAVNDMPDETGQGTKRLGDTHDVITGSNTMGRLRFEGLANTCNDWTSLTPKGPIGMGHAWPAGSGMHWIQVHTEPSCNAGVNLVQNGGGNGSSIGAGGGWGGIYCFALTP